MSDRAQVIMDAAERRIRDAGYSGFSFREIAADVGVASSSVHHHFPTKEALAAAVARRYTDRFEAAVLQEEEAGAPRVEAWLRVFRRAFLQDGRMCLCGSLGATSADLPPTVAAEARRFFERGLDNLMAGPLDAALTAEGAKRTLATLEGAMLLARALGDMSVFDQATSALV
ncbi:TetR/AcrR family transcriptional regulator [Acidisoma cellulosilytica]|uniref:TetR/AcrR family transcriptional regulator n=1 Tax=Acidisoma cellulosilyticum TaxID=2802395 RepID=A0A963Z1C7_9PROT|nr:TetR/AcrR family transcriptional regulator [Acidisoma cellulosilyticum]MCB8881062.1 TetR/AcrR family transcriptional regulator [Acidisoma cellulosilyticum]